MSTKQYGGSVSLYSHTALMVASVNSANIDNKKLTTLKTAKELHRVCASQLVITICVYFSVT